MHISGVGASGPAGRLARTLVVVAVLVMGAAAGCDGDGPTVTPPSSPAPVATMSPTAPADPVRAAADKAMAAYRGMWTAYQTASQAANPDEPSLSTYATGTALTTRGLVLKGEFVLNPAVSGFQPADVPTSVDIKDCADDSKALLYRASGELYNDTPGGRRLILATAEDIGGGTWKVTSFGARDVGTC